MGCKSAIAGTPGTRFYLYQPSRKMLTILSLNLANRHALSWVTWPFHLMITATVCFPSAFIVHLLIIVHQKQPKAQKSEPIDHQKAVLYIENRIDRWTLFPWGIPKIHERGEPVSGNGKVTITTDGDNIMIKVHQISLYLCHSCDCSRFDRSRPCMFYL